MVLIAIAVGVYYNFMPNKVTPPSLNISTKEVLDDPTDLQENVCKNSINLDDEYAVKGQVPCSS